MPYAYQCCAFGVCENVYKVSNQWSKSGNSSVDDLPKKDAGLLQVPGKSWWGEGIAARKVSKLLNRSSKVQESACEHPANAESVLFVKTQKDRKNCHLFCGRIPGLFVINRPPLACTVLRGDYYISISTLFFLEDPILLQISFCTSFSKREKS